MQNLPSLRNLGSFSTKDIMIMLGKAVLAENMPADDQNKIPAEYIAMFVKEDYLYAEAREAAKNPQSLIKILSTASALKSHITKNPKATEYKLYLEQLESAIKKADEQLSKQSTLARTLDATLPEWHRKNRENAEKLTRPGVPVDSPTMSKPIKETFELGKNLIKQAKEINHQSEISEKGLKDIIEATKMVLPAEVVKEAAAQATPTTDLDLDQERPIPLPDK